MPGACASCDQGEHLRRLSREWQLTEDRGRYQRIAAAHLANIHAADSDAAEEEPLISDKGYTGAWGLGEGTRAFSLEAMCEPAYSADLAQEVAAWRTLTSSKVTHETCLPFQITSYGKMCPFGACTQDPNFGEAVKMLKGLKQAVRMQVCDAMQVTGEGDTGSVCEFFIVAYMHGKTTMVFCRMVPRHPEEQLALDALPWDMMLEDKMQQDGRMHLGFSLDLAFFCRVAKQCKELGILDVVVRQLTVQPSGLQRLKVVSAGEAKSLTSSHMADMMDIMSEGSKLSSFVCRASRFVLNGSTRRVHTVDHAA